MIPALMFLAAACATSTADSLPGPAVVNVKMSEFKFEYNGEAIKSGRVLFKARNVGTVAHQIVLVVLPKDAPPISEQLQSTDRKAVNQLASFPAKPPGATGAFAVDLEPGRYAMICFQVDSEGQQHGARGMASEFTLR